MDIFAEQIVKIKNGAAKVTLMALIIIAAAVLSAVLVWFSSGYGSVLVIAAVGVIFGAYKLIGMLFVEYEYIVTNGTVDVDKITAKSSRKRIISFECKNILRSGRYNHKNPPVTDAKETFIFCNREDEAYYLLVSVGSKKTLIVLSPDDRIKDAVRQCVARSMANELFV